ncbi:FAD:protein FMN transferase [Clostridium sp. 19966]|uniref:FAD:protein FMN transferase n=1 Tax=Clostridium sp. 19966 TaxID=2768166 RepID=UPI0028DDBA50|nr:FAD:protein FMN transferase [Clostridium sp. 19966]MDT8717233.1 FAD:protein FMN transferase [Clostridium sp. 19966]
MLKEKNENSYIKQFYSLGTINALKAFGANSKEAVEAAEQCIYDIDDKMSVFKDTSEVSKINMKAGKAAQKVSKETYEVIKRAVYYSELSRGGFNPLLRPLLDLWGFGRKNKRVPEEWEIKEKLKLADYRDIKLDDKNISVELLKKGEALDLGAIAKGYAADMVVKIFKDFKISSGMIDLGGNIYAYGSKENGDSWNIGIQDPFGKQGEFIGIVAIKDKSIVTSGNYERYFEINGKRYHHIMNAKSGYPSEGIVSATIISDKSMDGDGLTTVCYTSGIEDSLALLKNYEDVEGIFITEDKKMYITEKLKKSFILVNNQYSYGI